MVAESSTAGPSARCARSASGPSGSRRGVPPVAGMTCAQGWRRDGCPAALTASTSPSGVQPISLVVWSPHQVSRRAAPPSTSVTNTSGARSRVDVHATRAPSGEIRGRATGTPSAVRR